MMLTIPEVRAQDPFQLMQKMIELAKEAERKKREKHQVRPDLSFAVPTRGESDYRVLGLRVGDSVDFAQLEFADFNCKPSELGADLQFCSRSIGGREPRGRITTSSSILLSSKDGRALYVNQSITPAYWDRNEIEQDIERRASQLREPARLIRLPASDGLPAGVIALWGKITLEPLDSVGVRILAAGQSPKKGLLLDFLNNLTFSAQNGLPIYQINGEAGYALIASSDASGKGSLRFLTIDSSAISRTPSPISAAEVPKPPTQNMPYQLGRIATENGPKLMQRPTDKSPSGTAPAKQDEQSATVNGTLARDTTPAQKAAEAEASRLAAEQSALEAQQTAETARRNAEAEAEKALRQKRLADQKAAEAAVRFTTVDSALSAEKSRADQLANALADAHFERLVFYFVSGIAAAALLGVSFVFWQRSWSSRGTLDGSAERRAPTFAQPEMIPGVREQANKDEVTLTSSTETAYVHPKLLPPPLPKSPGRASSPSDATPSSTLSSAELPPTEETQQINLHPGSANLPKTILPIRLRELKFKLTFEVGDVIAFDDQLRPLSNNWTISLDTTDGNFQLIHRELKIRRSLNLSTVTAAALTDSRIKTDVKRTVARAAITGLGWALVARGTGLGASVLDVRYGGVEQKELGEAIIGFSDFSHVIVKGLTSDIRGLLSLLPKESLEQKSLDAIVADDEFITRLIADAPKVYQEIDAEILSKIEVTKLAAAETKDGATFHQRDAARQRHVALYQDLRRRIWAARAAFHKAPDMRIASSVSFLNQTLFDILGIAITEKRKDRERAMVSDLPLGGNLRLVGGYAGKLFSAFLTVVFGLFSLFLFVNALSERSGFGAYLLFIILAYITYWMSAPLRRNFNSSD